MCSGSQVWWAKAESMETQEMAEGIHNEATHV